MVAYEKISLINYVIYSKWVTSEHSKRIMGWGLVLVRSCYVKVHYRICFEYLTKQQIKWMSLKALTNNIRPCTKLRWGPLTETALFILDWCVAQLLISFVNWSFSIFPFRCDFYVLSLPIAFFIYVIWRKKRDKTAGAVTFTTPCSNQGGETVVQTTYL